MSENPWVSNTSEPVQVVETGLYIEGEFLPDTPKASTEGQTDE